MRELLLLRHGKTKKSAPQSKWERPLKNSGKRNAQRLGAWLQEQGIAPDCVLCSPAAAARETAEKCIKAMGQSVAAISLEPRLETRDSAALLEVVRQYAPGSQRLMLVGHNPALERLIEQLLPADQRPCQQSMRPGTLVRMTLEQSQTSSPNPRAELLARVEPGMLPKTFAVPMQGRIEQRERPAYYYRQSAVIPYRFCAGQLQLLLITASSGRKWGIPKGIQEPGLSAQDSAAREALEEAGAMGRVYPQRVGEYSHFKWGANCQVQVYAMAVDQLQSDTDWEEAHRCRRWCTPEEAIGMVSNPRLAGLLSGFEHFLKSNALWHD